MIRSQVYGWQDAATFLWNDGRSGVPPRRLFAGRRIGPAHQARTLLLLVLFSTGVVWAQGRGAALPARRQLRKPQRQLT